MSHECNTAALRGGAEKCHSQITILDILDVLLHRSPGRLSNGFLILFNRGQLDHTSQIDLDLVLVVDGQPRLLCRGEKSGVFESVGAW